MSSDIDPEGEQDIIDQFEVAVDHAFHDAIQYGAKPDEIKEILDKYSRDCGDGTLSRTDAREWLTDVGGELGQKYFDEAEHQEGTSYWARLVGDMQSMKDDFALYVMMTNECEVCDHDKGFFDTDDKLRCSNCGEVQPL